MSVNRRNRQLGLVLFAVYLVLYGGFVLVMAFDAKRLQAIGPGGVNLAVWAGFGLIAIALVLALLYGWLCRNEGGGDGGGG